jgi:hypothetical protein
VASIFHRRHAHARSSVISVAIVSLLKELEAAVDPPCLGIARTAWSQLNLVSGPSNNVLDLTQGVENVVRAVKGHIERPKYTRNFLDKTARFVSFTLTLRPVLNSPPKPDPGEVYTRPCEESTAQGDGSRAGESDLGQRPT